MQEIWKGVIYNEEDFSEWLEVSNLGNVRNPKTGTIRKLNLLHTGYVFVSFSLGSRQKRKTIRVHKAVAESFIPNPEKKTQVNHIDGNKENNCIENLEWVTPKENMAHAYETGLAKVKNRHNGSKLSKLNIEEINYIKENYVPRHKEFGCRVLARKFGVSHKTISNIINNK